MSLVGAMSGAPACEACGGEYGGNTLHIGDADFQRSFAPNVAYTDSAFGNPGVIAVCDLCLWAALKTAFGYILATPGRKGL